MTDLIPVVEQSNELTLEQKERVKKYLRNNISGHLSVDKETGPFLLYLMGQDLEQVAKAAGYPFDIIAVTALHYQWEEKKNLLAKNGGNVAVEMQKQIVNMMLVATYLNARQEMAELLSGSQKDGSKALKTPLAARSLSSLKDLMEMVMKMNGMVDANGNMAIPQTPGTVIHAQNVQINNVMSEDEAKKIEDKKKSRAEMLKELADAKDQDQG